MKTKTIFIMAILLFTCIGRAAAYYSIGHWEYDGEETEWDGTFGKLYIIKGNAKYAVNNYDMTVHGTNKTSDQTGSIHFPPTITANIRTVTDRIFDGDGNFVDYVWNYSTLEYTVTSVSCGSSGITSVSIPNTVEYIGQQAFAGCAALKTVSSSSVKYIHWGAFKNCPELETVSAANSVVSIGREAFAYCPKLKHLNGVTSIDSIANHAFRQCPSLETVGGRVRHVGQEAFAGCEKLRTFFTGMECIYRSAFSGCSSLEAASVSSAKYIGEDAFLGCRSLSSEMFIIAEKVEQRAFYNCSAIPKVHINNTVKYIRKSAFYGCSGMEELTFGENPELEIGNCAFMGCYGLRDVTIRGKIIGAEAFRDCYDETGGSGAPQQAIGNYRKNRGNTGGTGLKNVTIDNSVTTIKDDAFYGCRSLETITIGNSVDTIKQGAFSNCSGLKGTLTFPSSVKFLGSSACSGCGMTNVELSPSLEIIQSGTFYECPNLESIDIPAKVRIIDDRAFYKCPKLTEVTMTGVDSIGDSAFRGCEELTSIALGDSLRFLGNYAFEGCTKIEGHIKFPKPLEYIGWKNFSGCRKITGIDLPDGLKGIGWEAFRECFGITKLTLPGELVAIGDGAFYNCWNIESKLVFSASLKYIGQRAFHNCQKLQGIDLKRASELESIGAKAFYGCDGLTGELWIPDAVTTVGIEAFWFCSGINSLYIGASLKEVGRDAFISFPRGNLTSIIVNKNNPNYDSRKDCNAMIETATNTLYKGCCRTVIPETVTAIGNKAFQGCDIIGEINIPDGVTSIGDDAFYACHDITRINLSENNKLASIGEEAFAHCYRLREIPLLYSIVTIGRQAFEGCYSMPGIIFGPQLKEIGNAAFNACAIQHATFKSPTPPTVGERAFIYNPEYSPYMFVPCNSTAAYQAAMPKQEKFIESDTYNVSVVSNDVEMGKVSYKSHDLCVSNVVTVTAIPEPGFRFLNWTGGISQNPCTFSVKGDIFLVAYFEAEPEQEYTIRALSNDSTKGTVTGGGVYLENATATLTALPKEGYQFIKWQDGNTDNPRSFVVTRDATFTAYFDIADGIGDNFVDGVQIYTADKSIVIGNAEGKNVNIYDLTGQLLINKAAIPTNKYVLRVERQGIYFVKVGNGKVRKVLIR